MCAYRKYHINCYFFKLGYFYMMMNISSVYYSVSTNTHTNILTLIHTQTHSHTYTHAQCVAHTHTHCIILLISYK